MDASPYEPARPSRLRLLLEHFSRIEDKRSPEGVAHKLTRFCCCASAPRSPSATASRPSLIGETTILGFSAISAVRLGRSLGALDQHHDEPDRSGPVRRLLHGLGSRLLAQPPDTIAIDGKTVRRSHDRSRGRAALHLVLSLRHEQPSGSRTGSGRRQNQRNGRHPSAARETRRRPQPRGRFSHDRRDRLQSSHRPVHPRRRSRLSARRQRQSADLAGRYRGGLRNR